MERGFRTFRLAALNSIGISTALGVGLAVGPA